jgi:hypothetical protein
MNIAFHHELVVNRLPFNSLLVRDTLYPGNETLQRLQLSIVRSQISDMILTSYHHQVRSSHIDPLQIRTQT